MSLRNGNSRDSAIEVSATNLSQNQVSKLNELYTQLAVKRDGLKLSGLSRPETHVEPVPGSRVHEPMWYGCIRWIGIEIWVRVRGKKKHAVEAAADALFQRYDERALTKLAKNFSSSSQTSTLASRHQTTEESSLNSGSERTAPDTQYHSPRGDVAAKILYRSEPASRYSSSSDTSSRKRKRAVGVPLPEAPATGPNAVETIALSRIGAMVLIDGTDYMEVAQLLWTTAGSAAKMELIKDKIAEIIVYCSPECQGILPAICTVRQVESSAKDARAVNIALDLARRLGELRKGYGVPSLSGRRKGRITAVYLAMKEKFAKPLLDILRREYVWSVRVQSGEELLQAISKPLDGFPS